MNIPKYTIFIFLICHLTTQPASAQSLTPIAEPVENIEQHFRPVNSLWLGADGIYSVPLPNDRYLWLFGDTLIGKITNQQRQLDHMPRNSIALQQGTDWQYLWETSAFFPSPNPDTWLWPGPGITYHGQTYLILPQFKQQPEGGDAFNFKHVGTVVATIKNPQEPPQNWQVNYKPLHWGHQYAAALYMEAPHLYLLGYRDHQKQRNAILARIKLDDWEKGDLNTEEYFVDSGQWSPNPDAASPLFSGFQTEASLHYDATLKRFVIVQSAPNMEPYIVTRLAEHITGPWQPPIKLYQYPEAKENPRVFCYAAKNHPHLAQAGYLIIGYACNSTQFQDLLTSTQLYVPRFIRVQVNNSP